MVEDVPRPPHFALADFAPDPPNNDARHLRGVCAGAVMRQPYVRVHSALGRVAMGKECLKCVGSVRRTATSAQFKRGSGGKALLERRPSRLIDRVRLVFFESRKSLLTAQWCQKDTPARRLRRNKHDTGDLQRTCREAKFRAAQVNLELLHAAAAANNGRPPDHGCAGGWNRVQRIATYVQKICNSRGEHRIRRHKYAVLR